MVNRCHRSRKVEQTIGSTFRYRSLAASSPNPDPVDHIALFRFVAQAACLVRPRRP